MSRSKCFITGLVPSLLSLALACLPLASSAHANAFDFERELFGTPSTLNASVWDIDYETGQVMVNGGDSQCPTTPFTWNWNDGTAPYSGWLPGTHTYADTTKNYVMSLTANYGDGSTDTREVIVRFTAPDTSGFVALDEDVAVTVSDQDVSLGTRLYSPPGGLTHFDDEDFGIVPRSTIEYVLHTAAGIQHELVNADVPQVPEGEGFRQIVLRDPGLSGGGMYSLWFTTPVSFGAAAESMDGTIQYTSFIHEMGHNFTLNSPGEYYYGGQIDGNANAIYSESMAQIFQHATGYLLVNSSAEYGMPDDLTEEIKESIRSSMRLVRNQYDDYVAASCPFASWNDPGTPHDETMGTFMTIAYKFFEHAENTDSYAVPLKRMMELLQAAMLDESLDLVAKYDRHNNTPEADAFRATLMVAAMSHGFDTDLRPEFLALNFPIDNSEYETIMSIIPEPALPGDANLDGRVDVSDLGILATNYGAGGGFEWSEGDFTGDGVVDVSDLGILATNYGNGSAVAANVPEPTVTCLLLCGLVSLVFSKHGSIRRRVSR